MEHYPHRLKGLGVLLLAAGCCTAAEPQLHIPEGEAKKAAVEKPAPEYPMMARQLKVVGKVSLEAVVGADGRVIEVRSVSGNPILTRAAADAVKRWRFTPFEADGKPAAALASLSFEFDNH